MKILFTILTKVPVLILKLVGFILKLAVLFLTTSADKAVNVDENSMVPNPDIDLSHYTEIDGEIIPVPKSAYPKAKTIF